jgi:hypothetical protein
VPLAEFRSPGVPNPLLKSSRAGVPLYRLVEELNRPVRASAMQQ